MSNSTALANSAEKKQLDNSASIGGYKDHTLHTTRTGFWWLAPLLTVLGFGSFVIYTIWAAFQGAHYYTAPYLSPFYSPLVFIDPTAAGSAPLSHSIFGEFPKWWPAFIPQSPSFFILIIPAVFRGTCYYYRKAYYRSVFLTPSACAVTSRKQNYSGETTLFLVQNIHRYTMYFAVAIIFVLAYDSVMAFFKHGVFGIGVGSIVLTINTLLLSAYTFGCHSIRHLIGGKGNTFGCAACTGHKRVKTGNKHKAWSFVSFLNEHHMTFAWISLFWVGFTDLYVRLVSMGIITDFNTWGGM